MTAPPATFHENSVDSFIWKKMNKQFCYLIIGEVERFYKLGTENEVGQVVEITQLVAAQVDRPDLRKFLVDQPYHSDHDATAQQRRIEIRRFEDWKKISTHVQITTVHIDEFGIQWLLRNYEIDRNICYKKVSLIDYWLYSILIGQLDGKST